MQTIGERFEDMRKRKGVSIREAAEATKIRGDYLQKFEGNQFDIGLSDIYVRGFLRSYAQFLQLPADRILNDFTSLVQGESRPRQPNREVYGRMDLSISTAEDRAAAAPGGDAASADAAHAAPHVPRQRGNAMPTGPSLNPALVFKGIIGLAVLLLVLLLIWVIKSLFGSSSVKVERAAPATVVAPATESGLAVIALDPVRVKVARQSDGAELFQGQLERNERREFPNVPLWITATALESIHLEYKGKQFMIPRKGYDRVPVDANQFGK